NREKERDHNDRLRAGGGARRKTVTRELHLSGVSATLPAHHDDNDGGFARRAATRARTGQWLGTTSASRHLHCRRTASLAIPHALHHAGDLSLSRPRRRADAEVARDERG